MKIPCTRCKKLKLELEKLKKRVARIHWMRKKKIAGSKAS